MKAKIVLALACGVLLFGGIGLSMSWTSERSPATDKHPRSATDAVMLAPRPEDSASSSGATVPQPISEPRTPIAATPQSLDMLLDTLPAEDQTFLSSVNERYFHALSFDDQAELDRLIALGFPTPNEWLAAQNQSDDALAERAQRGDVKAKMFLADRMIERMDAIRRASPEALGISEVELVKLVADLTTQAAILLRESPSPFAAYIAGQAYSLSTPERRVEPIIASFIAGWERGDKRAQNLVYEFSRRHPEEKATHVATSYFLIEGHKKHGSKKY